MSKKKQGPFNKSTTASTATTWPGVHVPTITSTGGSGAYTYTQCSCATLPCSCPIIFSNGTVINTLPITSPVPAQCKFETPVGEFPEAVWLNGLMLTLGHICSNVQCKYFGGHIYLNHYNVSSLQPYPTIIMQYGDYIYHYNVLSHLPGEEELQLMSKVRRKNT